MRKCPKCDGEITDGRRICRKCGSIVPEVEPPGTAEPTVAPETISELNVRLAKGDGSEPSVRRMFIAPEASHGRVADDGIWTCPKCASPVTHEFAVCWNCGTTRDGVEDPSFPARDACEGDTGLDDDARIDLGGLPSGPAVTRGRVHARHFRSSMDPWEKLSQQAADFATEVGPQRLISISHSEDGSDGVIIVWYWV